MNIDQISLWLQVHSFNHVNLFTPLCDVEIWNMVKYMALFIWAEKVVWCQIFLLNVIMKLCISRSVQPALVVCMDQRKLKWTNVWNWSVWALVFVHLSLKVKKLGLIHQPLIRNILSTPTYSFQEILIFTSVSCPWVKTESTLKATLTHFQCGHVCAK